MHVLKLLLQQRLTLKRVKLKTLTQKTVTHSGITGRGLTGQSLVEFAMAAPLLAILMVGTWQLGAAMHVGNRASSAMQEVATNKLQLASVPGNSEAQAIALVQGFNQQGIGIDAQAVSNATVSGQNTQTSLFLGNKAYNVSLPGIVLPFNFTSTQLLPSALLKANNGAGRTGAGGAAFPGVSYQAFGDLLEPDDFGFSPTDLPLDLRMLKVDCAPVTTVDIDAFNTLANNTASPLTTFPLPQGATGAAVYDDAYTTTSSFSTTALQVIMQAPNPLCDNVDTTQAAPLPVLQQACRYQLGAQMLDRWTNRIQSAGGCNGSLGNGGDVQFDTTAPSY
jgi:hypothetical protein